MKRLAFLSVLVPSLVLSPSRSLLASPRAPAVASYRIDATCDATYELTGRETVTFVNRTRHAFEDLRLHLYLNGFRSTHSTWLSEELSGRGFRDRKPGKDERAFGYSEITHVALSDGTDLTPSIRHVSPDDGNAEDRTLVSIPLPHAVAPGETLVFDLDFRVRFPRIIARTGFKDDFLLAAQWYPKLGKATDSGWNAHQFHLTTEFFADFGGYDVTLKVPKEWKGRVGATGVLEEESDLPGGAARVRFRAEDVIDFAWTASPRFEVIRDTFTYPGLPNVDLLLLLQPDHHSVRDRYLRAAKEALARYGTWYAPYPYTTLTIVDPPQGPDRSGAGGMEYPGFITGGAHWLSPADVHSPENVTVHEVGHQIFYALVATNEVEEAFLDEGFDSYSTLRALREAYGDPPFMKRFFGIPIVFRSLRLQYPLSFYESALDWQVSSRSDATTVPTFRQLDGRAVRANAYQKTGLFLASCDRTFGHEKWGRVMKTYVQRFSFKHPTATDFLSVAEEIAPGVKALFESTLRSSDTMDYAVTLAQTRRVEPPAGFLGDGTQMRFAPAGMPTGKPSYESTVVARRLGEAVWPTEVELVFEGGHRIRRAWDGKDRWIRYRATGPRLLSATVDPDGKNLLDVDLLNNGLKTGSEPAAADAWAHRLRFWSQNVLELFALLGVAH